MKILVTGGAGFCASHLVDRLIKEGHQVVIVDDLSTGKERNLNEKAKFYWMNINDDNLEEVFRIERPEVVNHHAAQTSVTKSTDDPVFDACVNVLGSLNLIRSSLKYGVEKFVYISSGGAIYGDPENLPVKEDDEIRPVSPYGISKHTIEHYLRLYGENSGLKYVVLRYPNVYGPRQDPHGEAGVVAIFSMQMLTGVQPTIFGDGHKTRDYVYIGDIVEANMLAMEKFVDREVYNLGWGEEVSDIKIFETVRKALGGNMKPLYGKKRPGEVDRISLDSTKVRLQLGWVPKVPIEEGIHKATEFYKKIYGENR